MRCSGSPTTFNAAERPAAASDADPQAVQAFEAMLLSTVMQPLAEGLGPMGAVLSDGFARAALLDTGREAG